MTIFDISQLSENNPWWTDRNNVLNDNKLETLGTFTYQWDPNLKYFIKLENDVIYTIRGPRQVGKTTLMKIMIKELLLDKKTPPENIFFLSCENIHAKELNQIVRTYLDWITTRSQERKFIFLDEICAVENWSRELLYFSNKGDFINCSIVITGSHSMDLKHSTELMPGRRGGSGDEPLDKVLLPMKFSEFVALLRPDFKKLFFDLELIKTKNRQQILFDLFEGKLHPSLENLQLYKKDLDSLFEIYLLTGGIPATINEFMKKGSISTGLFNIYLKAIIGDLHRFNYKELSFKQIVREIFNTLSTPISWNSFTKTTDVRSHNTVQEYMTALEELFVANVIYRRSIHDARIHSFMKKVHILDPFIFHALHGWSNAKKDYFINAKENVLSLEKKSKLVECVVYNHLTRFAYALNPRDLYDPKDNICYYRNKKQKEIDFLMSYDDNFYPFEVKYQATINKSDYFPFRPFGRGIIICKNGLDTYHNYVQIPISLFLLLI